MEKYLTKFEKIRIIGQRAEQISMGAPSTVDIKGLNTALEIAERELEERKIPLKIRRTLPDGTFTDYPVSDLIWD